MSKKQRIIKSLQVVILVVGAFYGVQVLLAGVLWLLNLVGVPFMVINEALLQAVLTGVIYALSLALVIWLPWQLRRSKTTRKMLGIQRLPSWLEVGVSPLVFIGYMICSGIAVYLFMQLVPQIDMLQEQDVGFAGLGMRYEYLLAFLALVVIAPVAEELLFRGYMYDKLKKFGGTYIAILVVSLVFGALHGQWNVAIDTFVLSVVLCLAREWTGTIWIPILVHMIKNGIAYYFLFISPEIIDSIRSTM